MEKLKVALLGYGGMGHFHATHYQTQPRCELMAICDSAPEAFANDSSEINLGNSGKADLSALPHYLSYEDLVRNEKPDIVDICLPGHLHAEYAIRAMNDGFHVLCEKPMARTVALADEMIATAKRTGRKLMIAQCLRFEPSYRMLREAVLSGKYGKLLSLSLCRNSAAPIGRNGWYRDAKCSGGALLDLHLHDTDTVHYILGVPVAVTTRGITRPSGGIDEMVSFYEYADGALVAGEASWCRPGWSFSTTAVFEKATVEVDGSGVKIAYPESPFELVKPEGENGYWTEIDYFARCVQENLEPEICSPESTRDSIRIALAEEQSALSGGRRIEL